MLLLWTKSKFDYVSISNDAFPNFLDWEIQMPPLKTSASDMVKNARAQIEEIETSDLITMMEDPNVVIVDIRDIRERQRSG